MSSWIKVKLSDVTTKIGDGLHGTPKYDENGEYYFINGSNLLNGKIVIIDESKRVSKDEFLKYQKELNDRTILVSINGTLGNIAVYNGENIVLGKSVCYLNVISNVNRDYIRYILSSGLFQEYIHREATGSTIKNVSLKMMRNFEFSLPEIETQNYIAEVLGGLDKKIQLNTQINQTLEQIAQTIFKSWFIDFDPVHAKANALANGQTAEQATQAAMTVISGKNTQELHRLQTANPEQYQQLWEIAEAFPSGFSGYKNLGEIPIGWNVLTFKDFISESKEKIGSLEDVPEYSVGNEGIYPRSEKYNKSLSKTPEKNKVVRIGDLVFGMGSKTLNWGIMNDEIGSVSPAYFVYRIFTNINYIYLNKYIKAKEYDFQNLIKPTSRQGQSVDKEMFLKKEIYVPNEYLLNIYLNKLKEIDSLVYSYTTEVLILEQIRDELLPKLLSGEI